METIVLANWKAHLPPDAAMEWLDRFFGLYRPGTGVETVLAVPTLCMHQVHGRVRDGGVNLAAQGVSPYPPGSYTGATPAAWLRGMAAYVLVGHQERRRYFHEGDQEVAAQVRECVAVGLRPIVCVDHATAAAQVAALDSGDMEQCLFAYTPVDAVRLETARGLSEIEERAAFLSGLTNGRPVLYGGGVAPDNAAAIAALPGISGVMVGRACLDPENFGRITASLAS